MLSRWNYRVVTYMHSYKTIGRTERLFKIVSVYYELTDNGDITPVSYGESKTDILDGHEDLSSLKFEVDIVTKACEKPILDLDNWPNEYNPNI